MCKIYKLLLLILLLIPTSFAAAINVPSSVNPAYVGQRATPEAIKTQTDSLPSPLIQIDSTLSTQTQSALVLKQLKVTGATVFSNQSLEQKFSNYIGKPVSMADLQLMANSITNMYQQKGYMLSKAIVSTQNLKNGVGKIQVIENK